MRMTPLTPTERQVVALIAGGLTGQGAAVARGVTRSTIETQVRRAMFKTGATSRAHLVAICLRNGWIR